MTVYSFACSTPDDWSNWHFLAKTFGPGLIAGLIASAAYIVARTQREIASNKYDLDLFDKRYPLFEKVNAYADKVEKYDTKNNYIMGNIHSVNSHKQLISYCGICIDDLEKIENFNIKNIDSIYDDITKSVKLYKNITPEMVSKLKSNVNSFFEHHQKTADTDLSIFRICNTRNENHFDYIKNLHRNASEIFRNEIKKHHLNLIRNHVKNICKLRYDKNIKRLHSALEIDIRAADNKDIIESEKEKLRDFLKNKDKSILELDDFNIYVCKSFKLMNKIKSTLIFIRNEMDKHLTISEVPYKKKKAKD